MVKILMCDQNSLSWHAARRGIPTASEADSIVTPTGKLSEASDGFAYKLLAERLLNATGTTLDGLPYLDRGKEHEPMAAAQYELENECKLLPVGLMLSDCGRYGASPDRLIAGARASVEIKAPAAATHIRYMMERKAPKYKPQIMMQLLVGELDYADFFSFHPRCPAFTLRTPRDEAYIATLKGALEAFCDRLDDMEAKARASGMWMPYASLAMPTDESMSDGVEGAHAREYLNPHGFTAEDYLSA